MIRWSLTYVFRKFFTTLMLCVLVVALYRGRPAGRASGSLQEFTAVDLIKPE
jgi:hypothetical protein